jgi:uncharacterized protein (DUF1697 family)
MTVYVALLRGVNVGGRTLEMKELVKLFESEKLREVRTYIQSGNVIFSTSERDVRNLKVRLQERIAERFRLDVSVILRSREELRQVIENNPLLSSGSREVERLHVTFLGDQPNGDPPPVSPKSGHDEFRMAGKEVYLYCPGGYGKTVYSNSYFEKHLGVGATTRNWRTVEKLYEITGGRGQGAATPRRQSRPKRRSVSSRAP